MTAEEFDKRVKKGQQLVILNNYILDVSEYQYNHPGGNFLISYNIGRDISKFFYGAYKIENKKKGAKSHNHSHLSNKIVNTLIIGRFP